MKIGVVCSRVRVEEKWIFEALEKRGIAYDKIDDREICLQSDGCQPLAAVRRADRTQPVLQHRAVYRPRVEWLGHPDRQYGPVAEICGDKLATSIALEQAGVPQPQVWTAFTAEAALEAMDEIGYPVVLKPVVGSWGRLLSKINDREAAETVLEHKEILGSAQHSVFYIQEYIQKPGRDIRSFVIGDQTVCAIYRSLRTLDHQHRPRRQSRNLPGHAEIDEISLAAAQAVGGGVMAMDILEDPERGYLVNEVNHTMEFHSTVPLTGVDIPGMIVDYAVQLGSR